MSSSLWSHGLQPTRLLCPWDFPDKNTGVSCQFLLQGIFWTQGLNPRLLLWHEDSLLLSHQAKNKQTNKNKAKPQISPHLPLLSNLSFIFVERSSRKHLLKKVSSEHICPIPLLPISFPASVLFHLSLSSMYGVLVTQQGLWSKALHPLLGLICISLTFTISLPLLQVANHSI